MRGDTTGKTSDYQVLVVDDEKEIRSLLEHYLEEREDGFEVATATNGKEALGMLRSPESHFDAVLLDISMPKMGGFETLKHIQEDGHRVVTIVLSGQAGEEDQLQAFDLGALDFVKKPFSLEVLVARLKLNLAREAQLREAWPDPWKPLVEGGP